MGTKAVRLESGRLLEGALLVRARLQRESDP
jgi:hypothetical protein